LVLRVDWPDTAGNRASEYECARVVDEVGADGGIVDPTFDAERSEGFGGSDPAASQKRGRVNRAAGYDDLTAVHRLQATVVDHFHADSASAGDLDATDVAVRPHRQVVAAMCCRQVGEARRYPDVAITVHRERPDALGTGVVVVRVPGEPERSARVSEASLHRQQFVGAPSNDRHWSGIAVHSCVGPELAVSFEAPKARQHLVPRP